MRFALTILLLAAALAAPAAFSPVQAQAQAQDRTPDQELRRAVVFFPAQSADLSELAQRVLDRQLALLERRPLALTGEATPEEGEAAPALSLARAEAVRDYLVARGVAPDQVTVSARVNAAAPATIAEMRPQRVLMN